MYSTGRTSAHYTSLQTKLAQARRAKAVKTKAPVNSQAQALAKVAPKEFKPLPIIAAMQIPKMIETLEQEAGWILEVANEIPTSKRTNNIGRDKHDKYGLTLEARYDSAKAYEAELKSKDGKRIQSVHSNEHGFSTTKQSQNGSVQFRKVSDGFSSLNISGFENLFEELTKIANDELRWRAKTSSILRAATNLLRYIERKGLNQLAQLTLIISPNKYGVPSNELRIFRSSDRLDHALYLKDLDFSIWMDKFGTLYLEFGKEPCKKMQIKEDGTYIISEDSKRYIVDDKDQINQADLNYLRSFIKKESKELNQRILKGFSSEIDQLIQKPEIKIWRRIDDYQRMPVSEIREALLGEVEQIKQYANENKDRAEKHVDGWTLRNLDFVQCAKLENITDKELSVTTSDHGDKIINFEIDSKLLQFREGLSRGFILTHRDTSVTHEKNPGYTMTYNYDENTGLTKIVKHEPNGADLSFEEDSTGKVKIRIDSTRKSYGNSLPILVEFLDKLFDQEFNRYSPEVQAETLVNLFKKLEIPRNNSTLDLTYNGYRLFYDNSSDNLAYVLEKDGHEIFRVKEGFEGLNITSRLASLTST